MCTQSRSVLGKMYAIVVFIQILNFHSRAFLKLFFKNKTSNFFEVLRFGARFGAVGKFFYREKRLGWKTHLKPFARKTKKYKKPSAQKKCHVFPPGAAPAEGNCVELASGGLAGATLSREIDL